MTWIGTILLTFDRSQIYTRSQRYSKDCSYPDSRRTWKAPRTSTDSSRLTGGDSRPRPPSSGCSVMFAAPLTKSADQWWYCSIYPPHSIPSTLIPCCVDWNTPSASPDRHYSGCGHTWRVDHSTSESVTTNPPSSLANSAFLRVPFSDQSYSPPTSHRSLVSSRRLASIMPNMPMIRSFTSSFVTTTRCSL